MNKKLLISTTVFMTLLLVAVVYAQSEAILVSDNPADHSAAEILANKINASVVMTTWGTFNSTALSEIQNLGVSKVVIIGGTVAIPENAETQLEALGIEVKRLAGKDRYETASLIASFGWPNGTTNAVIVQGHDAEGIRIAMQKAKAEGMPILYVTPNRVPERVKEQINALRIKQIESIQAPDLNKTKIEGELKSEGIAKINFTKRNMTEASEKAIERAETLTQKANESLGNLTANGKSVAAYKLYEISIRHLNAAKEAYANRTYGRAFGQAISSAELARASIRISENIVVGDLKVEVQKAKMNISKEGIVKIRNHFKKQRIKVIRFNGTVKINKSEGTVSINQSMKVGNTTINKTVKITNSSIEINKSMSGQNMSSEINKTINKSWSSPWH